MKREEAERRLASPLSRPAVWLDGTSVGAVLRDVFGQVGVESVIDPLADREQYDSNEFFAGSHRTPAAIIEYLSLDFGWHIEVSDIGVVECWAPGHAFHKGSLGDS